MGENEAKKTAALEEAIRGVDLLEDAFTKISKGKKFFGGDQIGYLDIALGSFLGWIQAVQKLGNISLIDQSKTPKLYKWAQDFLAEDAVKDVVPQTEKLMEFAKALHAKAKAKASTSA